VTDRRLTTTQWKRTRVLVLIRDHYQCQVRGPDCKGYATEVDHIVSRTDGGAMYDPANLRACCKPCNGWRAARRTNDKRFGYRTTVPEYDVRL
jgi:5-methylcytosine-specific restriction protein A